MKKTILEGDFHITTFEPPQHFDPLTASPTVNGETGNNINLIAGGSAVSNGVLVTPTIVQCLSTTA
jgi:hypothetical protein